MEEKQDNNPMLPYSSEVIKDREEEQKEDRCCFHFWCWFFQIGVWIFLLGSILLVYFEISIYKITFGFFGFFYFIYIILELCSPTRTFLKNKNVKEGLKETLRKYIKTAPEIEFYGRSYHVKSRWVTRRDSDGRTYTELEEEEFTTYAENYNIPYYSSRDVSGLFRLNCEKNTAKKKCYIKLELGEEIKFADTISYLDRENEKKNLMKGMSIEMKNIPL